MFLPHFDVFCDLWLNRRTATWNLFVLFNNETNYYAYWAKLLFISKYFNITRKPAFAPPLPTSANTKKAIWRNLWSLQNEAISLVAMRSKELWLVQENHGHCQTWVERRSLRNENLQRKQNWTAKSIQIVKKMLENSSQFLLYKENCRGWKYHRKACGCGQPRGHLIVVLNERSVGDGGNFCRLWLVILESIWYSARDTF